MAEFSMNEVVEILRERGITAYVEQTGGGVATIYAGDPFDSKDDPWEGVTSTRYPAVAGPGWYEDAAWTDARADTAEFYVGLDDDGETDAPSVPRSAQPKHIADIIATFVARGTPS